MGDFEDGSFLLPKDWSGRRNGEDRTPTPRSTSSPWWPSPACSPGKPRKEEGRAGEGAGQCRGYQQPTVSSRTRALSPYTHRKMCQLSEEARQRLAHLQLGPHHFKKETAPQRPFLVGTTGTFSLYAAIKSWLVCGRMVLRWQIQIDINITLALWGVKKAPNVFHCFSIQDIWSGVELGQRSLPCEV